MSSFWDCTVRDGFHRRHWSLGIDVIAGSVTKLGLQAGWPMSSLSCYCNTESWLLSQVNRLTHTRWGRRMKLPPPALTNWPITCCYFVVVIFPAIPSLSARVTRWHWLQPEKLRAHRGTIRGLGFYSVQSEGLTATIGVSTGFYPASAIGHWREQPALPGPGTPHSPGPVPKEWLFLAAFTPARSKSAALALKIAALPCCWQEGKSDGRPIFKILGLDEWLLSASVGRLFPVPGAA